MYYSLAKCNCQLMLYALEFSVFIQCGKTSELHSKIKAEVCVKSGLYAIVLF